MRGTKVEISSRFLELGAPTSAHTDASAAYSIHPGLKPALPPHEGTTDAIIRRFVLPGEPADPIVCALLARRSTTTEPYFAR